MAHRFRTIAQQSTTLRGYGTAHQRERRRRLPLYTDHDPCGYCGRPLGPDRGQWHLPHNADRTGYLPGFWHRRCNILDGAKRGNARAAKRRVIITASRLTSRRW